MNKNAGIISPDLLGQLSKVFVTERLGIRPEHHELTSDTTWIRLAERLMKAPASKMRRQSSKAKRQGGKR
ncbi:hypothetical protein ABH920_005692 [Catenulispora sp. EB89]|uniref:hypothetical protein n=1 Tax=Catenulispora sp. EB89 TaxID=3156257 RepID=UPI0035187A7F